MDSTPRGNTDAKTTSRQSEKAWRDWGIIDIESGGDLRPSDVVEIAAVRQ